MNNSELESILKKAQTPEPSEEFLEMFPRRVVARLNHAPDRSHRPKRSWVPRVTWAVAFGVICLFIGFAIGHRHGGAASEDVLQNVKLIRETLAMFPNRVRAIVQDERGLNVVLSEQNDVPASTPLYIRICNGKDCQSVVTFSGQEIQVAGQKVTVLSDAEGGIILMGNQFLWSNTGQVYVSNDLKIEARALGSVAM